MIIVEGPSNSGKTTLVNQLSTDLMMPVRDPFKGPHPGDDLIAKVVEDLREWPTTVTSIYEGYPLIGEYIYGPLHRKRVAVGFNNYSVKPILNFFWEATLIIYCRPPEEGVQDPALLYYDFLLNFPLSRGRIIRYDYTKSVMSVRSIELRIEEHDNRRIEDYDL